jgi:hypothetical protein
MMSLPSKFTDTPANMSVYLVNNFLRVLILWEKRLVERWVGFVLEDFALLED